MDNLILPHHQFEIRYTPILDFSNFAKTLLAPYIQRTFSFSLENENTRDERISLHFEEAEAYSVLVWWDRIIFRSRLGIDKLEEANSLIQEPYFAIFQKIKEHKSFGKITYSGYYNVGVLLKPFTPNEELNRLKNKYLQKDVCENIIPNATDIAITLEHSISDSKETLRFGPYSGNDDFANQNIKLSSKHQAELLNKAGTFFTYQLTSQENNNIDFKVYRNNTRSFTNVISKLQ